MKRGRSLHDSLIELSRELPQMALGELPEERITVVERHIWTRRRKTIGISRRSLWGSSSTYKSDFVSGLPTRPSNEVAYLLILLGICGIAFAAWFSSEDKTATGFALVIGIVSFVALMGGIGLRKSSDQIASAQASWDRRWVCARCGNQWQA